MIKSPLFIALFLIAPFVQVLAQEPAFMEAATHPGRHQLYTRYRLIFQQAERGDESDQLTQLIAKGAWGIRATLALLVDAHWAHRDIASAGKDQGLEAIAIRLKQRILQYDPEPLNTIRASLTAGIEIPGENERIAPSDAPNVTLGAVITAILGRHGLNGQADLTTGSRDTQYQINLSHLYRLAPATYAADTTGAWYTMLEWLNEWDENGDGASFIAPGLLYEARRWAAEIAIAIPFAENGDLEYDYRLTTGYRWLF